MGDKKSSKKKKRKTKRGKDRDSVVMRFRDRAFVDAFLKTWNAVAAAKIAGIRVKSPTYAWLFLKRPTVQEMIQEELETRADARSISADKIVAIIYGIADASLKDFASWTSNDLKFVPSSQLTRSQARAIKSIEVRTNVKGFVSRRITLHDPMRAAELMARIRKLIGPEGDGDSAGAQEFAKMVRRALTAADERSGAEPPEPPKPLARKRPSAEGKP